MAIRNTRVRKRLFIDSKVQGTLLLRLIANWVAALSLGILGMFFMQIAEHGLQQQVGFYFREMWADSYLVFVLMLISLPAIAYDSVKVSHRFAGPHYAVRMAMKKLAKGESINPVTFRKGDFWEDIAANINRVAANLGQLNDEEKQDEFAETSENVEVASTRNAELLPETTVGETVQTS